MLLCWAALGRCRLGVGRRGGGSGDGPWARRHIAKDRGHIFPFRGPHWDRGPVGEFGAPRTGGRTHEGFDVIAACGTKLVAARGGRVLQNRFDPELDGNEVLIHARGTGRNYRYSHLRKPAIVEVGEVVSTGQRIGGVGKTGNAQASAATCISRCRIHGRRSIPSLRCVAGTASASRSLAGERHHTAGPQLAASWPVGKGAH